MVILSIGRRVSKQVEHKPLRGLLKHLVSLGFTNRYAIYLLLVLVAGIAGGFYLAVMSIRHQYIGALACWTVVFTPIGTAIGVVLGKIVDKNRAENVSGTGDGITFASAQAKGFVRDYNPDSPEI